MSVDILLGLQWGDEGKGKIVDVLTPQYRIVARFQGGPNAGHTLEFEGKKYVLRSVPSGIFQGDKINVIGNGVTIDPVLFKEEITALEQSGVKVVDKLLISNKAHLILPAHRLLDACYEQQKGEGKIGTTGKGIGPAYTDKIGRCGLRVGDLFCNFEEKYSRAERRHVEMLESMGYDCSTIGTLTANWKSACDYLRTFNTGDTEYYLNRMLNEGSSILAEGAQGSMLDVDFGTYPFVTSSNTIAAGACAGLGVAPSKISEVYGILKAYCTRVGSGPFPTELNDETGDLLRRAGNEFGSVTGRPRRCGWLDLVALRYTIMLSGVTQLIMTKSDVMDSFESIKVCTAYKIDGKLHEDLPFDLENCTIEPQYTELPGWKTVTANLTSESQFPKEFSAYISFLEERLQTPIRIISLGPDRRQTVLR